MTETEARDLAQGVAATALIRGGNRVESVAIAEMLPTDWVVVVRFWDHPDPCLAGSGEACAEWLARNGGMALGGELAGMDADQVARRLIGEEWCDRNLGRSPDGGRTCRN